MTRILRLLLIAAIALPIWQPIAAQEVCSAVDIAPLKNRTNIEQAAQQSTADAITQQAKKAESPASVKSPLYKVDKSKRLKSGVATQSLKVLKVTKNRADVPDGYSLITLNVLDAGDPGTGIWGDGTGYQMLLDADHNTYGTIIPESGPLTEEGGDVPASTYAEFEYKIPENADGALSTTNMVLSGTSSITIPAGTYDWCITNPSPLEEEEFMWIAGDGRSNDYVFESGFSYTFTVSLDGESDKVEINITSPYENPANLAVSDIYEHQVTLTWTPGGDETSWKVEYKKTTDSDWTTAGTTSATSYVLENLSTATEYQVRVQGIYTGGVSGWEFVTFSTNNSTAPLCDPEDMGEITYTLSDSWGDGWNNASITIRDAETGNIIETLTISSGRTASGTVSLCYGRTVNFVWTQGNYASECSFTITGPDGNVISSVSDGSTISDNSVFATYTMSMPGQTQSIDFGNVDVNSSKTLSVYIENGNTTEVQATLTVVAPFYVSSNSVTLQPGTNKLRVTFTPTAGTVYNGTLTVDINGTPVTIALKGIGNYSGPNNMRDRAFFEGITYTWKEWKETDTTEPTGPEHTSNLAEIATDPDQIIAMLREVYMNKEIPGNFTRGCASTDGNTYFGTHDINVQYTGAGEIKRTSSTNAEYKDTFGWNIPGDVLSRQSYSYDYVTYYYWYMDPEQYKPYNEGLTMLLLEIQDGFSPTTLYKDANGNLTTESSGNTKVIDGVVIDNQEGYAQLREIFSKTIKSARILTEAKRSGEGENAGTLFKIDCDKMNKFYFIAKGQLQWLTSVWYEYRNTTYSGNTKYSTVFRNFPYTGPCYIYRQNNTTIDKYVDPALHTYFTLGHMFEQFSPAEGDSQELTSDLYWQLKDMMSFNVIHDCPNVPYVSNGHHFMMYGVDSKSDDCQDVRDLMFFVPDYRMMDHSGRGLYGYQNSTDFIMQDYFYYHPPHKPSMGLFVIKQNPITGQQKENEKTYKLHLTWTSNLLSFLPDTDGQYDLYRVITNADGTKTYQKVGVFNPNTFAYDDEVPMDKSGKQVTYVVQGRDVDGFLSLQMSNEESFVIPGYDHAEQLRIALNSDYYFSRYDAADKTNNYSNSVIANNSVGTNVRPEYIENGSQFKFWRATIDTQTGEVITPNKPFVVAEVSNWDATTGGTLTYKNWEDQTDFSEKPYGHGYHANPTTSNITIDNNGEVVFDGLKLYDNFSVDITDANDHPTQYVYYVTLETAVPFGLVDNIPSFAVWQDGKIFVYFEAPYTDWYEVRAYAWDGDDKFAGEWAGTEMTHFETYNGKKVYQWSIPARDNGALPASIIFSWKDGYNNFHQTQNLDYSNGGYYTITDVDNSTGGLVATTSAANTSNSARSNTVSVPVYKTAMSMYPLSWTDVEGDVTHSKPASTKFTLDARYSSKTEILGYYIYRWADTETDEDDRSIYEDNGDDSSPQGQAGNQSEYYTVAMNTDYTDETDHFQLVNGQYADVTATFMDNYMSGMEGEVIIVEGEEVKTKATEADTYTYAPVVELFAPYGSKVPGTNVDRGDYNTYGGPQQMTAGGLLDISVVKHEPSKYSWTGKNTEGQDQEYRYYNVGLKISGDPTYSIVPEGYYIAKVRAWRKIERKYLGEQAQTQDTPDYTGRLQLDTNGEYMFVDKDECQKGEELGDKEIGTSGSGPVCSGTFGAVALQQGESIPMSFVVRVYFTKAPTKADPESADGKYYIAEYTVDDVLEYQIPTAVENINASQVAGVKYYNPAGIESDKPFKGVNIVVTRYSDGSTTTTKILK